MPLPKPLTEPERLALSKAAIVATQRLRTLMHQDPHLIINSSHGAERMAKIIDEAFAKYPPPSWEKFKAEVLKR
jgi:hypothetical protein